jgi:hypothetical protein
VSAGRQRVWFGVVVCKSQLSEEMVMLFMVLVVLLLVGFLGGAVGQRRFGYASWSPLAAVAALAVLLYVTGHLG